jgi:hypothetical protein
MIFIVFFCPEGIKRALRVHTTAVVSEGSAV